MSDQKEKDTEIVAKPWQRTTMGRLTIMITLLVLLWNTVQIWLISGVVSRVDQFNSGAMQEMGTVVGDVKTFGEDLNEIRRFLLLPEHQYGFAESDESTQTGGEEGIKQSSETVALFKFLTQVEQERQSVVNRKAAEGVWTALVADTDFQKKVNELSLVFGEKADLQLKLNDALEKNADGSINATKGQALFNIIFSSGENSFHLQSVLGDIIVDNYASPDFSSRIVDYLKQNAVPARERKAEEAREALAQKSKQEQEKKDQLLSRQKEFDDLMKDAAFRDTLQKMGLRVAEAPREELNKRVYDVVDGAAKVQFSLALEISSGQFKVLRNNQEINLQSFLGDAGSKKKT